MIDVFLARKLFDAISPTTQVIIVGDEDQLPSVGPGYVLGDLIASNQIKSRLTEIHRQAKDSISLNLHPILTIKIFNMMIFNLIKMSSFIMVIYHRLNKPF